MQRKQLNWAQRGQLWLRLFIRVIGTVLILLLVVNIRQVRDLDKQKERR